VNEQIGTSGLGSKRGLPTDFIPHLRPRLLLTLDHDLGLYSTAPDTGDMERLPVIERAVVDPNGDTLLILKNPKWELPAWKTAPQAHTADHQAEIDHAIEEAADDMTAKPDEVHILVSYRQLRIVSVYFDNMFKGCSKKNCT
jgi:hypothetical protein